MSNVLKTTTTAPAAANASLYMQRDTFYQWLAEVQGITGPGLNLHGAPDFRVASESGLYSEIAGYRGTSEGTVIAWHRNDSSEVEVMLNFEPTQGLHQHCRNDAA